MSRKTSAVVQLAAAGTAIMRREICEVFIDERVDAGIASGSVPAHCGEDIAVHAHSNVPHIPSMSVTERTDRMAVVRGLENCVPLLTVARDP